MILSRKDFLTAKMGVIGLTIFTSFCCVSCQSNSSHQTIQIQVPEQDHFTFNINSEGSTIGSLNGFSYSGPFSAYDVQVHHTFSKGLMSIEPSIVDIDTKNKTFSVFCLIKFATVGEISGIVSFSSVYYNIKYESKPIFIDFVGEQG